MLIGLDLQSVKEIKSKPALLKSGVVFSDKELEYCAHKAVPSESIAGIFSGKEAFIKAVSKIKDIPLYCFTDIEIRHDLNGRPYVSLNNEIRDYFEKNHLSVDLSVSHTDGVAGSTVLIFKTL